MINIILNRLFIAGVSIILILPNVVPSFILVDFEIHKDYIAEVLCIEKDIEESTCNGKCHLSKELKKADENKKNTELLNSFEILVWLTPIQSAEIQMDFLSTLDITFAFDQGSKLQPGYITTLEHPPQV